MRVTSVYSAKSVFMMWGAVPILDGVTDGLYLSIEREAPRMSSRSGCDGEVQRRRSMHNRATATVKLMANAEENTALAIARAADELSNVGVLPFTVIDRNSRFRAGLATRAWIVDQPDWDYASEATDLEWKFEMVDWRAFTGGYPSIEAARLAG